MIRKLTKDEIIQVDKQLKNLGKERVREDILVREANFILHEKIPQIVVPNLQDQWLRQKSMSTNNLRQIDNGMRELNKQLKEGVEIKKHKKDRKILGKVGGFVVEEDDSVRDAIIKINPKDIEYFKNILKEEMK